jgi:hypothetical protein
MDNFIENTNIVVDDLNDEEELVKQNKCITDADNEISVINNKNKMYDKIYDDLLLDGSLSDGLSKNDCIEIVDGDELCLYCPIINNDDIDIEYFKYLTEYIKINIDLEKISLTIATELTDMVKHDCIKAINGFKIGDYSSIYSITDDTYCTYQCDYCKISPCHADKSYYCYDCYKNMCKLCYSETSEEIAIKNGATKFMDRKDALDRCRKHKLLPTLDRINTYCDECKGENVFLKSHYRFEEYDLCDKCYNTSEYENKSKMIKTGDLNFGSLRGWFNIVDNCVTADEYTTYYSIICNLDKNSEYYKSFGLYVECEGYGGYWNLNYQDVDTLINEINNAINLKHVNSDLKSDSDSKYVNESYKSDEPYSELINESKQHLDINKYKNCSTIEIMALTKNIWTYFD